MYDTIKIKTIETDTLYLRGFIKEDIMIGLLRRDYVEKNIVFLSKEC